MIAILRFTFKVYKPRNLVLLFRVFADVISPINNPKKKRNIWLVMGIWEDISNTGRKIAGDKLYSSIDTIEELIVQEKKPHVRTIIPNSKGLSVASKTAKGRHVLSSEFIRENNSQKR